MLFAFNKISSEIAGKKILEFAKKSVKVHITDDIV